MNHATLAALLAARRDQRAVVLATRLPDGAHLLYPQDGMPEALGRACAACLADDESGAKDIEGERWLLQVQAPRFRLIVIGAVHIAQALLPLAQALDYAVTIVDPRLPFNSEARFAGVTRLHDWPDEAMARLQPDRRTAVVALSHDAKLDDPALDAALRSDALYVGALGSRRSQAARLQRMAALGHGEAALARLRGPVGLALGAVSPSEIALSILAELVAVRRGSKLAHRG